MHARVCISLHENFNIYRGSMASPVEHVVKASAVNAGFQATCRLRRLARGPFVNGCGLRQHHARAAVVVLQSGWRLFGHVSRSGGRQRPSLAPSGSEWGRGVLQTGQGPLEAV